MSDAHVENSNWPMKEVVQTATVLHLCIEHFAIQAATETATQTATETAAVWIVRSLKT
jgi:hypothetical protein